MFRKVIVAVYNSADKLIMDILEVYRDRNVNIFDYDEISFEYSDNEIKRYTKLKPSSNSISENFYLYDLKVDKFQIVESSFKLISSEIFEDSISFEKSNRR